MFVSCQSVSAPLLIVDCLMSVAPLAAPLLADASGALDSAGSLKAQQLPRRVKLLYNHVPKTGGQFAIKVLRSMVAKEHFKRVGEFISSNVTHRKEYFVVAGVRSECEYYVSLFAFGAGSCRRSAYCRGWRETFRHDALLASVFDNATDVNSFARFLNRTAGLYSLRARNSLPDMAVDCWVRTENEVDDLARCLMQFAVNGGELANGARGALDEGGEAALRELMAAKKQPHPSEHLGCDYYFGEEQMRRLVQEADADICAVLDGSCQCCGGNRAPPIRDGAQWPPASEHPAGLEAARMSNRGKYTSPHASPKARVVRAKQLVAALARSKFRKQRKHKRLVPPG